MSSNNARSGILNMKNMTASLLPSKSQAKKKSPVALSHQKTKQSGEGILGDIVFSLKMFLIGTVDLQCCVSFRCTTT